MVRIRLAIASSIGKLRSSAAPQADQVLHNAHQLARVFPSSQNTSPALELLTCIPVPLPKMSKGKEAHHHNSMFEPIELNHLYAVNNEHIAVTRFREFLRIKTVQPNPDYKGCTDFLEHYANELGLGFEVVECAKGKPHCILTWEGSAKSLPSVMLNCHSDVVPVSEVG